MLRPFAHPGACCYDSLLLRRFVFLKVEASDCRWTARDHGKGTDGRRPPSFARTFSSRERRLGTRQLLRVVAQSLKPAKIFIASCKPTQGCWPKTLNIVGSFSLRPRPHLSVFVWKRRFFFFGLAYRPHRGGTDPKTHHFKNALQSEDHLKALTTRLRGNRGKRRFPNFFIRWLLLA